MTHKTLTLPIIIPEPYSRYTILTCNLWRVGVIAIWNYLCSSPDLILTSHYRFKAETYKLAYRYIPYKYYAETCSELIYEIGNSLLALSKFNIEESEDPYEWYVSKLPQIRFNNWKMFMSRGDKQNYGNVGIRILNLEKVRIKLFKNYNDTIFAELRYKLPRSRKWVKILETLIEKAKNRETYYHVRLYVNGFRDGKVFAKLYISIPLEIWNLVDPIIIPSPYPCDKCLGIDVNTDRINFVLINEDGNILDMYTLWFKNLKNIYGYRRQDLVGYFGTRIPKILREFSRYGKYVLAVEDPEIIGLLKTRWIKIGDRKSSTYNFKVSTFASWTIEYIEQQAHKQNIYTVRVNPKGTTNSEEHDYVMSRFGLDRHMASAYLITLRGLQYLNTKNI